MYQVFIMTLSLGLWQYAIAKYGVNKIAPFMLLRVLFTVFAGVVFLSEDLNIYIVLGMIMTISGAGLATISRKKQ